RLPGRGGVGPPRRPRRRRVRRGGHARRALGRDRGRRRRRRRVCGSPRSPGARLPRRLQGPPPLRGVARPAPPHGLWQDPAPPGPPAPPRGLTPALPILPSGVGARRAALRVTISVPPPAGPYDRLRASGDGDRFGGGRRAAGYWPD